MTVGAGIHLNAEERDPRKQNAAIRQLMEGRTNNIFSATLSSSAGSTTITNSLIGPNSTLVAVPQTANAASQMTLLYVSSVAAQTATIVHGNNANADQIFNFVVIG